MPERNTIVDLIKEYDGLNLIEVIDYKKFNSFLITHHSTRIEGSTLTKTETELLLNNGLTPKNKPLEYSLMVLDHYQALMFIIDKALQEEPITISFIQQINAEVMKRTGAIYNTILGVVDATKGEFRKGNVTVGQHYFPNYDKVENYTKQFVTQLNEKLLNAKTDYERLQLSFAAHFDLVSIHPFYDGNGRTSRLLMNYIQLKYKLPLAIVFEQDKGYYIEALQQSRKQESIKPFEDFMINQYNKHLKQEISNYKKIDAHIPNRKKGRGLSFFY